MVENLTKNERIIEKVKKLTLKGSDPLNTGLETRQQKKASACEGAPGLCNICIVYGFFDL
jgi:hypothetical protein